MDSNSILEDKMETDSVSAIIKQKTEEMYSLLELKDFDGAENIADEIDELTQNRNIDTVRARVIIRRDYNPGGRLAVTFPKSVGQVPFAFPFKPGSDSKGRVRVDGVLYPFGYGLSYTTFEYSALKISKPVIGPQENMTLSCIVKNTGKRAGDEVVQLYIRDDFSSVTTYDKVLRGFERIHLQPGEEQTISFTLTPQDLGLWDKNNQFTVEPGSFSIMIGASSQDIRLKGSFEVQ